jgi:hypothetical protein
MKKNQLLFEIFVLFFVPFISTLSNSANTLSATEPKYITDKNSKIDLNVSPIILETPPFSETISNSTRKAGRLSLNKISITPNQITDEDNWLSSNSLSYPAFTAPNPFMGRNGDIPGFVPERYQDRILTECIYDEDYLYLVYGKDFAEGDKLFIIDSKNIKLLYAYDFTNYIYSPDFIQSDKEYIYQRINWAKLEGSILYFSHSHSTYASSSKNMNAYITALDVNTNKVIWRSRPLVCNSRNFIIEGDIIISGYGFTREKDYIYMINKYSGKIENKIKIKSAADMFIKKDNKLYVRTYDTDYIFEIRREK